MDILYYGIVSRADEILMALNHAPGDPFELDALTDELGISCLFWAFLPRRGIPPALESTTMENFDETPREIRDLRFNRETKRERERVE